MWAHCECIFFGCPPGILYGILFRFYMRSICNRTWAPPGALHSTWDIMWGLFRTLHKVHLGFYMGHICDPTWEACGAPIFLCPRFFPWFRKVNMEAEGRPDWWLGAGGGSSQKEGHGVLSLGRWDNILPKNTVSDLLFIALHLARQAAACSFHFRRTPPTSVPHDKGDDSDVELIGVTNPPVSPSSIMQHFLTKRKRAESVTKNDENVFLFSWDSYCTWCVQAVNFKSLCVPPNALEMTAVGKLFI